MSEIEHMAEEAFIESIPDNPYAPCPCGCGKKFKFVKDNYDEHYQRFIQNYLASHIVK